MADLSTPTVTRRVALAGGVATLGGLVFVGSPPLAGSAPTAQDVRILNFALLLDEVERGFYAAALKQGAIRGELRQFAEAVLEHEREHVTFLRKALGAKARKPPKLDFGNAVTSDKRFINTSIVLEDNSVAAYNGQAGNLSAAVLGAAATIVSVEARHAAWVRAIAGKLPAADAVDAPRTAAQALAVINKLGFLKS